jgi:HK97 family phage major capsid protein
MTYETKADALDGVFETAAHASGADTTAADIASLKADVARLNAQPLSRPALKADAPASHGFTERYLRKGLEVAETKSLNGLTPGDGGVAVPREIDAAIDRVLRSISPIRAIANVVQIGSAGYRKLIAVGGIASGWVSETGPRPETATDRFEEIAPHMGELYANPAASQAMLDDAMFDVEGWLAGEIGREFARAEGLAFVQGDGIARPKGFLTYPVSNADDGTRPFGTIQTLPSGSTSIVTGDKIIDLVHALRTPYRQGACFVMSSATLSKLRQLKDTTGAYIWAASLTVGQPATLLGYPVVEAEAMPDIATNSLAIAFGNFQAAYLIADRTSTQVLRDPYSNKPFVHFYATRRIGGALVDSQALKLMKFSVA